MKPFTIALLILFWIAVGVDCYFLMHDQNNSRYFSKCLLMPLLMAALWFQTQNSKHQKSKIILSLGLFFAFLGDLLLLLPNENYPDAFIFGIFCFLIAHLIYIFFFYRLVPFSSAKPAFIFICALVISAYFVYFLSKIWLGMTKEDLAMPVILYACAISIMLLAAVNTINGGRLKKIGYRHFIPGGILFVASDSIFALNEPKLGNIPIANAEIWVIVTYAAAQFLITTGGIRIIKK